MTDSGPKKAISGDAAWVHFDPRPRPSSPPQPRPDAAGGSAAESAQPDASSPAQPTDAGTQSQPTPPDEAETPPPTGPCSGSKLERGCPCLQGTECATGACVEGAAGTVCAGSCFDSCPDGWHCANIGAAGPDAASLCVPRAPRLCRPCHADEQCRTEGTDAGARCVSFGVHGSFCGSSCGAGRPGCPEGYLCEQDQCVPEDGLCACLPGMEGAVTRCLTDIGNGYCWGTRTCTEGELSPCAQAAHEGICAGFCTEEVCSERRGCATAIMDGFCFIDGGCYPEGVPRPGSPCEVCDPARSAIAWSLAVQGASCDDGEPCTAGDACHGSMCVGSSYSCDDGVLCTEDRCDGTGGCTNTSLCDDHNPCTVDSCDGTGGCIHTPLCDDGNPCTEDSCDARAGCTHLPHDGACDDGDSCTSGDRCSGGACTGQAMICPDGMECHSGLCSAPWSREQVIDARPSLGARLPRVVPDIAGGFTVFWLQTSPNATTGQQERRVEASGFDTSAARTRGPLAISPASGEDLVWARGASANATGSYHVTWAAPGDDGQDAVLAELTHDLALAGSETVPMLHELTGQQSEPVVAALTGGYVVGATTDYFDVWGNVTCICEGPSHETVKPCQRPDQKRVLRFRGVGHDTATQVEAINGCRGETLIHARHDQLHLMAGTTSQAVLAFRQTEQDGRTRIRVDRFNPLGVHLDSGSSELTIPPSSDPAVARAPSGDLLVVWAEGEGDASDVGVVGRAYAEGKGFTESERFVVNSYTLGAQEQPAAASVGDGVVVVWTSWWQDGSGGGIYAQRFQLAGDGRWVRRGEEEQVNVEGGGHQSWPSVAAVGPERFVVVWEHLEGDASVALRGRVLPW